MLQVKTPWQAMLESVDRVGALPHIVPVSRFAGRLASTLALKTPLLRFGENFGK
jgi:hypothetical protein